MPAEVDDIRAELDSAGPMPPASADRSDKKNYAESLSRALAQKVANSLRKTFDPVLPDEDGAGHESAALGARGPKKLDVNYSTPQLGLGLGISIKTINYPDGASGRFTKNYSRVDNELRAEALDYHRRQPFAILVGILFLPVAACSDSRQRTPSSFGTAVEYFRARSGRLNPKNEEEKFELFYVALYEPGEPARGKVGFFDVRTAPPRAGRPSNLMTYTQVIEAIKMAFRDRNAPEFKWAD